ncbi:hypothetical protein [Nitrososphaera sp.]|uniref:hypothetical protein n=1 Tax=Nitrososphaera sp. TaxID=1971748 RepID=UPI00184A9F72|nr:hypothetical protein [Nitrososphaera sp.]NWG36692.1 hypothetical protein [Nitrososphaera sp.]
MAKLLIIGGYPKGYKEPFSYETRSGKVLRRILSSHNIEALLMDLWGSRHEEEMGRIKPEVIRKIQRRYRQGYRIIVVGRYMYNCLMKAIAKSRSIDIHYLPHPASRTNYHRRQLEHGLIQLSM